MNSCRSSATRAGGCVYEHSRLPVVRAMVATATSENVDAAEEGERERRSLGGFDFLPRCYSLAVRLQMAIAKRRTQNQDECHFTLAAGRLRRLAGPRVRREKVAQTKVARPMSRSFTRPKAAVTTTTARLLLKLNLSSAPIDSPLACLLAASSATTTMTTTKAPANLVAASRNSSDTDESHDGFSKLNPVGVREFVGGVWLELRV